MQKRKFLRNIHYLRAFAIICVVTVHTWTIPQGFVGAESLVLKLIHGLREVLFHDATIFFVFISGFLFHYLPSKASAIKHYKAKFTAVVLPYLLLTSAVIGVRLSTQGSDWLSVDALIDYYFLGTAQVQYWYIPFISVVFLVSPLIQKIPENKLTLWTPLFLVLPLLGTREGTSIIAGQFLYFFPIYMLGMVYSINYEKIVAFTSRHMKWFLIAYVIALVFVICLRKYNLSDDFVNPYESAHYVSKMLLLCILVVLLKKLDDTSIPALNWLADYSFAIFFMHGFVYILTVDKFYSVFTVPVLFQFPLSVLYTLLVTAVTLALCVAVKKLLGSKSKMVMGV